MRAASQPFAFRRVVKKGGSRRISHSVISSSGRKKKGQFQSFAARSRRERTNPGGKKKEETVVSSNISIRIPELRRRGRGRILINLGGGEKRKKDSIICPRRLRLGGGEGRFVFSFITGGVSCYKSAQREF